MLLTVQFALFSLIMRMLMKLKKIKLFCGALLICSSSYAQVDVGAGVELGFPLMFNGLVGDHHHAAATPGARVVLNYAPDEAKFTGTLVGGVSSFMLPMLRFNNLQDVLYMNFTNVNVTLLGRFRKSFDNDAELLYGVGVGANFLKGNRVQISKRSDNEIVRIIEDSTLYNRATLPSFYVNAEYIRPMNSTGKVYYGIGVQLQYIYMLDQGLSYRIDMIDKNFQYFSLNPELTGHVLNPMFYINLYYRFGK